MPDAPSLGSPLPRPAGAARIAAIVPTLDRLDDMLEFVGTLVAQTVGLHELIVVDAGAPSPLEHRVSDALDGSGIVLRYATSEPGTSLQRNIALDMLDDSIDYVFLFDDDVLLEPDYIERSIECFALPFDPPVGCVLGTFTSPSRERGWRQAWFRLFGMTHSVEGDQGSMSTSGGVRWLIEPSHEVPIPVASGGRTAYLRTAMKGEYFDEFLPGYTMSEDVEYSHRIAQRWTIVHSPRARLFHKRSPASRVNYGDRVSRLLYSRFYFFHKHLPKDPRHVAAFAWTNVGIVAFYTGVGLIKGDRRQKGEVLRGLATAYRKCAQDLVKR